MSMTAVPISIRLVFAPTAANSGNGEASWGGEVMDPEIGPVRAELFGGNGEIDRLQQRIGGRARLRLRRGRPMPEREKTDLFHEVPFPFAPGLGPGFHAAIARREPG